MAESADGGDAVRVPKWLLAFVIPAVLTIAGIVRMEMSLAIQAEKLEALANRLDRHQQEEVTEHRENEARFSQHEADIQALCTARRRDDRDSNRPSDVSC